MNELSSRAAQKASQEEVFQSLAYAALKARAARIAPNQIIRIRDFELMVSEDENGAMRLRLRPQSLPKPFPVDMWIKCLT